MLPNYVEFNRIDLSVLFYEDALKNIKLRWKCRGVSIDSRTIEPQNLFIALKGQNIDAHTKVFEALEKGASACVVNKSWYDENFSGIKKLPLIVVENTLKALGKLAQHHRRRFNIPIVAIAGSNGKTTTKDITAHLLSQKYNVLKTYENFNNQIGLPLMLFQLSRKHRIAVLEIGTNEPGEIDILTRILEPTHGLITNIGKEHLEKLIDLDGVEQEETYLFGYLRKVDGFSFINIDDERLRKYAFSVGRRLTYGTDPMAEVRAEIKFDRELHPELTIKYGRKKAVAKMQTTGNTTALNAVAGTAVAFHFGLTSKQISEGLSTFTLPAEHKYGRMKVERVKNTTILNDCYNANPSSMSAAYFTLKEIFSMGKRVAVLGDMLELGEASFEEHLLALKKATECADNVLIVGTEMKKAFEAFAEKSKIEYFDDKDLLGERLKNLIKDGDTVLVKGSRSMKMETVVEKLKEIITQDSD